MIPDKSSILIKDPFDMIFLGRDVIRQQGLKPAPWAVKQVTPYDLPKDPVQCCHVDVRETEHGCEFHYCSNPIITKRHGYLCQIHYNQEQTVSHVAYAPDPDAELKQRMCREVEAATNVGLDYRKYLHLSKEEASFQ